MRSLPFWIVVGIIAAIAGGIVAVELKDRQPTKDELQHAEVQHGLDALDETGRYFAEGKYPPADSPLQQPYKPPKQSWPVRHPGYSGLIVALAILFIARLYLFMHRLESR